MDIRLNIKMRCSRRRNGAAYQHYRLRSVTARHVIIIHRRHMENRRSQGMFLRFVVARLQRSHGPIVLPSPVNGSEAPMGEF